MRNTELRYTICSPTAKTRRRVAVTNINRIGLPTLNDPYYMCKMTPAVLLV